MYRKCIFNLVDARMTKKQMNFRLEWNEYRIISELAMDTHKTKTKIVSRMINNYKPFLFLKQLFAEGKVTINRDKITDEELKELDEI